MTKVLIVVAAVLSLVLAALTVAYAANAERLADAVRVERVGAVAAQSEARAVVAAAAQEKLELERSITALNGTIEGLETRIRELEQVRRDLTVQREEAVTQASARDAQLRQLTATTGTQSDIIRGYREQVLSLQDEQLAASRREIELVDRLNDLESRNEVLDQTTRALREQLAEVQLALQSASGGTGVAVASSTAQRASEPFDPRGLNVSARVQRVFMSPSGQEMVQIDAGSNSGLRENMRLMVVRPGGQFLANVILTNVDPRQAVGRVDKLGRQVDVREGDRVISQVQ